ncbi:hypothetical protein D9M70_627000 [compost metagenome]
MNGQWRHFELRQNDLKLPGRHFTRRLIGQHPGEAQPERGGINGRLIRRHCQARFCSDTQWLTTLEERPVF